MFLIAICVVFIFAFVCSLFYSEDKTVWQVGIQSAAFVTLPFALSYLVDECLDKFEWLRRLFGFDTSDFGGACIVFLLFITITIILLLTLFYRKYK